MIQVHKLPNIQLPPIKELIQQYGLRAKKALGQHFLLDPLINQQIIDLAGDLNHKNIIEVGPGPGGLTRAILASNTKTVTGVEIDRRAVELLQLLKQAYPERFHIISENALKHDLTQYCPAPRQIIANLPYNIGTMLLLTWLKQAKEWERMTLMFQQEVALRICAAPNTEFYGRLSVIAQWVADCTLVKHIPPGAFSPPPKVYSSVVNIIPKKEQPSPALFKTMELITASAFGQRRKMLKSALKPIHGSQLLSHAGIDETRRAETLSVSEFDSLARLYHENLPS